MNIPRQYKLGINTLRFLKSKQNSYYNYYLTKKLNTISNCGCNINFLNVTTKYHRYFSSTTTIRSLQQGPDTNKCNEENQKNKIWTNIKKDVNPYIRLMRIDRPIGNLNKSYAKC